MTLTDLPKLKELVALIDTRLAAIAEQMGKRPEFTSETMDISYAWLERKDALIAAFRAELEHVYHARFAQTDIAHTLRMAGVSASCAMGWEPLLENWRDAAARRIEKAETELAGRAAE